MTAAHTLFDYLDVNPGTDRQVARSPGPGGQLGGGRPPTLYALSGDYVGPNEFGSHDVVVRTRDVCR